MIKYGVRFTTLDTGEAHNDNLDMLLIRAKRSSLSANTSLFARDFFDFLAALVSTFSVPIAAT